MELEEAIKILNNYLCEIHIKLCSIGAVGIPNKEYFAIETVLNELKKYRDLYIQSLANNLNQNLKNKEKSNEQLEALNEGWKLEVEKKDKMIDEIKSKLEEHIQHCKQEARGSLHNKICHISLKFDESLLNIIEEKAEESK